MATSWEIIPPQKGIKPSFSLMKDGKLDKCLKSKIKMRKLSKKCRKRSMKNRYGYLLPRQKKLTNEEIVVLDQWGLSYVGTGSHYHLYWNKDNDDK